MPKKDDKVHTTIYLPRTLHQRLRVRLVREGKTLTDWAREQAEEYLKPKRRSG